MGIVVSAAVLLVAGCGGGDTKSADTGVGDKDVATGGRLFKTADAETAKLGSDAAPGAFPRTVKHALGSTEIPAKPSRVVVLDSGELDDVLALGITPVGMATTAGQNGVPSYLADKAQGIKTVGGISELNLEAIAALKPDLILGSKLRANDLYDKLSAIAPTVFSIRPGFPWKENFLLVADSVGEEDKATGILNDYQKRANDVKSKVQGTPTISLVRFRPGRSGCTATCRSSGSSSRTSACRGPRSRTSRTSRSRCRRRTSARRPATGSSTPATANPTPPTRTKSSTATCGSHCPR